jgi:hypothetical protein
MGARKHTRQLQTRDVLPTADRAAIIRELDVSMVRPRIIDPRRLATSDSERFLQAVALLKGCILLAHDTATNRHYIADSLETVRLLIQGVTGRHADTRRLLPASRMQLEVCIAEIRDVSSVVKMLLVIARMRGALKLIEQARNLI